MLSGRAMRASLRHSRDLFSFSAKPMSRYLGSKIMYTHTDEAPALATYSLLPIIRRIVKPADIELERIDISLAGRIISQFPDKVKPEQVIPDNLQILGEMTADPGCNIIKLPNISASVPQLEAAIMELRSKGYDVPMYPASPGNAEEEDIQARYAKVLGSAVNPVLREGNSDRRVALPVKEYAARNPHRLGMWNRACRSHVAHMTQGDFYSSEQSTTMKENGAVRIEHVSTDGTVTVMKEEVKLLAGEVIDSSRMQIKELCKFFEEEIQDAHDNQLLLSLHLKATMMKVSDPIMFGHCVKTFFKDAIEKHESTLQRIGFNANNGLGDLFEKIETLSAAERKAIERDINECYKERPWLAMVDSSKGITNLHVPSDVIVDASMPVVVRDSGKMWNKDDELEDTKCLIPDRCYATFYQEVMSFVKSQGQFDVTTMGNVANVGLMAQKAEEYGSHDKTFEVAGDGTMRVVDAASGVTVFEHSVETGDIWRMCQTKDVAIKDWVKLAVSRARATGDATTFWLDKERAHDRSIIAKVEEYMKDHDTAGLKIDIKAPVDAVRETMARAVKGENSISVTGNVLRDYLTDLFPIIELGTSAKMLSIVPLLNGGGMFETGAGGSAPKHVQQFVKEGHLRWDSLGEYLALAVSLEHLGQQGNDKAMKLGQALNQAIGRLLTNRKSPSRKVNELDNRASNFYVGLYWAEFMAEMDPSYKALATELMERRTDIVEEFKKSQGEEVDVGGYYMYDDAKAALAMQPSSILNSILEKE